MTAKMTAQEMKRQLGLFGVETEIDFEADRLYVVAVNLPRNYMAAIERLQEQVTNELSHQS
jgi:hypothetical protein